MATDIGLKIGIQGEKEYTRSLQQINAEQRTFKSELQALESSFNDETSAMEKNRKKGALLEKGIKDQEKRVEELEKGLDETTKRYGENSTKANKWKQDLNKAKTELNKMRAELEKIPKPLSEIGKSMQSAGKKMKSIGDTATKYVTAPLVAVGAASIAAYKDVDDAMDSIAKATGATGQALTDLENSAKGIATTIPTSFETAAGAVSSVSTRFGVTGKELDTLSTKFVKFAEINNTDVTSAVEGTQKVMAAFGLETEDADDLLDAMNKTGQKTGISMDTLQTSMVKNAASLQEMGLNAYQAADFLGQVETSGADTSVVMSGLSKALVNANEEGKTLPQALSEFQTIMNSTATDTEKLNAATELFGKKAGAAIYEACKTGSLSFESLSTDAETYLGSVETTFDNILDPADDFTVTMNNLKVLGSEVGKSLINAAAPAIKDIGDKLKTAADWFASLDENQQTFATNIGIALAAGGPVLSAVGRLTEGIGKVVEKMGSWSGFPTAISSMLTSPIGLSALAVGGLIAAFNLLDKTTGYVNEDVQAVVTGTNDAVSAMDTATQSLSKTLSDAETELGDINGKSDLADDLINELADLESQTNLTAEQQGRMRTIVGELNGLFPELGVSIDSSTGKLNKSTAEMKSYVEQTRKMKLVEAYQKAASKGYEDLAESAIALKNAQKQQGDNQKTINGLLEEQNRLNSLVDDGNGNLVDSTGQFVMAANALDGALSQNAQDLMIAEEKQKELNTATESAQKVYDTATSTVAEYEKAASETAEELGALTESTETNTETAKENTAATDENAAAIKQWGSDILSAAGTAVSSLVSAQTAWSELYQATKDSIESQMGLFDEWEEDSEVTIDSMIKNLDSQIKGMQKYSTNMEKLSAAAAKSSDPNFKAVVKSIAEMGVDGAAYADALVTAMETDQESFNKYLSMIGGEGSREEAQDNLAEVLTYVENDFQTGMQSGMSGIGTAINSVFGNAAMKKNLSSLGGLVKGAIQKNKELETSATSTGKKLDSTIKGSGETLKTTAQTSSTSAKNSIETTVGSANPKPEVKKVEVPKTVTDLAKQTIANGVSNVHGKISGVSGAAAAGSSAKTTIESKIGNMKGNVTKVSATSDSIAQLKRDIQASLNNTTFSARVKGSNIAVPKAEGGFVEREQYTWIAEQNKPEVVIPLSPEKRTRALSLYEATGRRLGLATADYGTGTITRQSSTESKVRVSLDAEKMYAACKEGARQGMENANIKIYIGEREAGRLLRNMGVSFA